MIELAEALEADISDVLAVSALLKLNATTRLSMLSFEECKKITDYFEDSFDKNQI